METTAKPQTELLVLRTLLPLLKTTPFPNYLRQHVLLLLSTRLVYPRLPTKQEQAAAIAMPATASAAIAMVMGMAGIVLKITLLHSSSLADLIRATATSVPSTGFSRYVAIVAACAVRSPSSYCARDKYPGATCDRC